MKKDNDVKDESQPQELRRIEEGDSYEAGGDRSGLSEHYIANASLTPVEGGHFTLKFQVLHKETQLPGGRFTYSLDKRDYCTSGVPGADGWYEGVITPPQPGPTWVKITSQGHCPITDLDHIVLVYPEPS